MYSLKEILLPELKPALGCTEPAAIALNAAYLKEYVKPASVKLTVNTNLLKNAMYVPIPNTGGKFGVKLAYALGLVCGERSKGLNLFEDVREECLNKALEFCDRITLDIVDGREIFIKSEYDGYEAVTEKFHDAVTYVKTPGKIYEFAKKSEKKGMKKTENWLKAQRFETLFELLEKEKDFRFVKEAVEMNLKLAQTGIKKECGLNIGKMYMGKDVLSKILFYTVSASDARMEGVNMPAMSLVGSGNHGISATLPVWVYGRENGFDEDEVLRAVALSMLITLYVKLQIGRLSPICGAAFASGCGVAGGIAYMRTGDYKTVTDAVSHVIQTISGVICDGAKVGCSLKVHLGARSGYDAAVFAISKKGVFGDGILENDITKSIENLSKISEAMKDVDGCIVEIMKKKAF